MFSRIETSHGWEQENTAISWLTKIIEGRNCGISEACNESYFCILSITLNNFFQSHLIVLEFHLQGVEWGWHWDVVGKAAAFGCLILPYLLHFRSSSQLVVWKKVIGGWPRCLGPSHPQGRIWWSSWVLVLSWSSPNYYNHLGHEPADGRFSLSSHALLSPPLLLEP